MKTVIIIGAGPAGLTAAYELLKHPGEYRVVVLEATDCIGGISKTVTHNGNRMDMGGHRFFSKVPEVNEWWQQLLPMQGKPGRPAAWQRGPDSLRGARSGAARQSYACPNACFQNLI